MRKSIRFGSLGRATRGRAHTHPDKVVNIFCVPFFRGGAGRLRSGLLLSLLRPLEAKKFRYYRGRCTHAFINIFSRVDVNLEVSFIDPTLPLAETNKTIRAVGWGGCLCVRVYVRVCVERLLECVWCI